jgi:GST-like protein
MVVLANERTRADGGAGPIIFASTRPRRSPYAIDRYTNEVNRLFGVINKRLASHGACVGWV